MDPSYSTVLQYIGSIHFYTSRAGPEISATMSNNQRQQDYPMATLPHPASTRQANGVLCIRVGQLMRCIIHI